MAKRLAIFIWQPERLSPQTKYHSISDNYKNVCIDFEAPSDIE
jgi:hypothetical protein